MSMHANGQLTSATFLLLLCFTAAHKALQLTIFAAVHAQAAADKAQAAAGKGGHGKEGSK
jgi:hypothetical protein